MDVTEVVRYLVGPTERQGKDIPVSIAELAPIKARKQPPAGDKGPGHDGAQGRERSADGRCMPVAGHGSQQEALSRWSQRRPPGPRSP